MRQSVLSFLGEKKYIVMLKLNEGFLAKFRKKHIKKKSFTIISNNCWGGIFIVCSVQSISLQQLVYLSCQMII